MEYSQVDPCQEGVTWSRLRHVTERALREAATRGRGLIALLFGPLAPPAGACASLPLTCTARGSKQRSEEQVEDRKVSWSADEETPGPSGQGGHPAGGVST